MTMLRNLLVRFRMISSVQSALRGTLKLEDIHSIILSTMIARSAMDFSRAMLFGHDETKGVLRGLAALGGRDAAENERLHREVETEERAVADMVKSLAEVETSRGEEDLFNTSLKDFSNHSSWITTFQKFGVNTPLAAEVRQIELAGVADPPSDAPVAAGRFVEGLLHSDAPRIFSHARLARAGLPEALLELLPGESLWTPIRTQKGSRLVLVADKLFHPEPILPIDLIHVEWFVGQVALALENAEMFQDLEQAFQSLRELDRMKSNFLATISHELRTPLTAINGYVQLMLANRIGFVSPGQKEVLERIHAHSDLLTGKVNDLIEIAEMDAGRAAEAVLDPVDALNAVMAVLPRVESRRAHKGVTVEPVVISPIPLIRANKSALERIFFHLLDNAIKFGQPHGHVWIEFEALSGELHVRFIDNGIGISPGQLQHIFDTFYQIDNQLTRSYEGLGIGLAVIKKQLDFTGGRIEVQSEPDKGSTFTVIYPLAPPTTEVPD